MPWPEGGGEFDPVSASPMSPLSPNAEIRKLSILIPVYNEIRTLETLLEKVLAAPLPCEREIVVVDDGSTDGSREILRDYARRHSVIRLFLHKQNGGKGKAVRTAIRHMTGDWAIIQDADLEYDPNDWQAMLVPVEKGIADAVYGSRFMMGRYRRALYFWHTFANKILTTTSNVLNDLNLTDMETCYKLVRADILKSLNLRSHGFDLEPELTAKLARWGARIYEVPISYQGRSYVEGKKIRARDALQALAAMVRYRFFDRDYIKHDGFLILQAVRSAERFNRWLFSRFERYLGGEVLEAGSGIGNLTSLLLDRRRVVSVDNEEFYVRRLQQSYGNLANYHVAMADLADRESLRNASRGRPFDSVICINVLEHIENDREVLENFSSILRPGGHAVILVPHDPNLYTEVDRTLGHCRRYTREELSGKLEEAGFELVSCEGFNRVGGLGWRISGKVLRRRTLSTGQMRLFELLMPIIRRVEKIPFHPHNSLIAIGRRPANPPESDV